MSKKRKLNDDDGKQQNLTSSLFGGSETKPLTSSIFGKAEGGVQNGTGLFADTNNNSLHQAVEARIQENVVKARANARKSDPSESQNKDIDISPEETLRIRRKQSVVDDNNNIVVVAPFPAAAGPADHTAKTSVLPPPEETISEIAQIVRQHGFAVVKDVVGTEILNSLSSRAAQLQDEICGALVDKQNIQWGLQKENTEMFRFAEVASRCKGRMDVRCGAADESSSFHNKSIVENSSLLPIVNTLLGGGGMSSSSNEPQYQPQLVYAGLILSFPGSEDQPWHQDGMPLFPELGSKDTATILPPYALNIFLPLTDNDATIEAGPTEFVPGSHRLSEASVMELLDKFRTKDEEEEEEDSVIVSPLLKQGDALIYDYRVCHRGTSNLTGLVGGSPQQRVRRILYLMYARPWFKEHLNFGTKSLFSTNTNMPK